MTGYIITMVVTMLMGAGVLSLGVYGRMMSLRAQKWPTVPGKIISCQLDEGASDPDSGRSWTVKAEYKYTVNGLDYTGNRIAFAYFGGSPKSLHSGIFERISASSSVPVYYDPEKPSHAVIECGIEHTTFILVFGIFFFFGSLAIFIGTFHKYTNW